MQTYTSLVISLVGFSMSFGFVIPAWGQTCDDTDPQTHEIAIVGGAASCALGQFGCSIDNGVGTCNATDPNTDPNDPMARFFQVDCSRDATTGKIGCSLVDSGTSDGFVGWDAMLYEGVSGGQSARFIYPFDVPEASGIQCYNQQGKTSNPNLLTFCADGKDEPGNLANEGTPKVGASCANEQVTRGNGKAVIYGVEIDATGVPEGQGETTIIVAVKNSLNNDSIWVADRFFGFADIEGPDLGQIHLRNVCVYDPATTVAKFVEREQCDPDDEITHGPETDKLGECPGEDPAIKRDEMRVGFQGSGYVGGAGSNRYW